MKFLKQVEEIADRVVRSEGMELFEVEWKPAGRHSMLRVYIDKPDGITLDDCENISKQLSVILDVENVVSTSYTLEVSSPGLDRKLRHEGDFKKYVGHLVKIQARDENEKPTLLQGRLQSCENGIVGLEVGEHRQLELPVAKIERANLVVEWS